MDFEQYLAASDPDLRAWVLARAGQSPAALASSPAAAAPVASSVRISERTIPGPAGAPDLGVRIYTPGDRAVAMPALLFIHGGGFTGGTTAGYDYLCTRLAEGASCLVVSVGYRLAPAHPFPAAPDDCYAAALWLTGAAVELGVDPLRIAVGGSSAGANLSAALALMARDRGGPAFCCQMLLYPCLDDRNITPSSHAIAADGMIWNRMQSINGWRAYLGPNHQGDPSPYAAPARAESLAGLPPAYVMAAELDLLRDEDIEYATRLLQAGVPTELHVHPGAMHGFLLFGDGSRVGGRAITAAVAALARAFDRPL